MKLNWFDKTLIWLCGDLETAWYAALASSLVIFFLIFLNFFTSPPVITVGILVYLTFKLNRMAKEKKNGNIK